MGGCTLVRVDEGEDVGGDFFEVLTCHVKESIYSTLIIKRPEREMRYFDGVTSLVAQSKSTFCPCRIFIDDFLDELNCDENPLVGA